MRRTALAGGSLLLLSTGMVTPALAQQAPETGWWSRSKVGAPAPLPETPDTVVEGGLQVGGDPTGPTSVAALRLELPDGVTAVELRLPVTRTTGSPAVQVCRTAVGWTAVDGGRLDAAPAADCAPGTAQAAVREGRLVVPLSGLQDGTSLDVLLEPVAGSAFVLELGPATPASVLLAGGGTAPAAAEPPTAEAPDAPPETGPLSALPAVGAAPLEVPVSEPLLAAPPVPPGPPPVEPAPPELAAPLAPAPPLPALAVPAAVAVPVLPDGGRQRVAALALLAGLVGLSTGLLRQPAGPPVLLGGGGRLRRAAAAPRAPVAASAGTLAVRGVGRFRAPRAGRPPRV